MMVGMSLCFSPPSLSRLMPFLRLSRILPALFVALTATSIGCSSDSVPPTEPSGIAGIKYPAGNAASDTVAAVLTQALIAQVYDSEGNRAAGVVVRFEAVSSDGYSGEVLVQRLDGQYAGLLAVDTTDAKGEVSVIVRLGQRAGPARLVVHVPIFGYADTARYTIRAGNARSVQFTTPDTTLLVGGKVTAVAVVRDTYGNVRASDHPTYQVISGVATVDAAGTVTAQSPGVGRLTAAFGGLMDTVSLAVVPDFTLSLVHVASGVKTISTVRTDGSSLVHLTPVSSDVTLPTITASGATTVFYEGDPSSSSRIYTVGTDNVRHQVGTVTPELTAMYEGRVSADGQWIYFTGSKPYVYDATMNGPTLWRVHLDGSGQERLTGVAGSNAHSMSSPSHDGTKVVFVNQGIISVLDLATRTVTALGLRGTMPRFSPDGTKILYVGIGGYDDTPLNVANADGTGAQAVTLPGRHYDTYATPDWSPDGKWIVARGGARVELWRLSDGLEMDLPYSSDMYQPSFKPAAP
jgi:WD40 repeat protein